MKYRKLDASGDYTIGQNAFHVDTPEAVVQAVTTRLLLWRGEWFLNTEEGMPWVGGVLGKISSADAEAVIREYILETEGVLSIDEYTQSIDSQERALSVAATISTIYGQAQLNEVL